jgi:hypothetical protein
MAKENKKKDDPKKLQNEVKQVTSDEVNASEEGELVSRKKVIYVEIDEEVTEVFEKISKVGLNHVYMVVPQRAIIFQSVVNLKILKRKAADGGKKIYLITNDQNGIHLGEKVGIPVYNKASGEGVPRIFSTEMNDERLRITPLRASVNSVEDEAPTRLSEKKMSISEILMRTRKDKKSMHVSKIDPTPKSKKTKREKPKMVLVAPNRHALFGLVAVSLVILLVIIYVALPGVTVVLTPAASKIEKSVNIVLADYQRNKSELETAPTHMIASYPIENTITKSISHSATGKKFSENAANASGKVTIINTTETVWPLVTQTRFQTDEGIVFRISGTIEVPAATSAGPGKVESFVTADQTDAYGSITGERGNIGPSRFFLPGLREASRSKVYAESYEDIGGGVTDYITFITPEDTQAAQDRLKDSLLRDAGKELQEEVDAKSDLAEQSGKFVLLQGEKAIQKGEVDVEIEQGLEGREVPEFTVTGSVAVSGVYYDQAEMLDILRKELLLKKSPQKELLDIREDSSTYRIFEWDDVGKKIKVTANIRGIEQYEIDEEKDNGQRLLSKIKDHIVGEDIDKAKLYIQNLKEVNKVEIQSWPAWSPTIPNIPDNIEFEVRDSVTVD